MKRISGNGSQQNRLPFFMQKPSGKKCNTIHDDLALTLSCLSCPVMAPASFPQSGLCLPFSSE